MEAEGVLRGYFVDTAKRLFIIAAAFRAFLSSEKAPNNPAYKCFKDVGDRMITAKHRIGSPSTLSLLIACITFLVPCAVGTASADSIDEVRQTIEKMKAVSPDQGFGALAEFFVDTDARTFAQIDKKISIVEDKQKALESLVQSKLRIELPESVDQAAGQMNSSPDELASINSESLTVVGNTVVGVDNSGEKMTFVKVGNDWKIQLSARQRKIVGFLSEATAATEKYFDALTAGVNNGTLTKANFEAKAQEIGQKIMAPVMMKIMMIMMQEMTSEPSDSASKPEITASVEVAEDISISEPEEEVIVERKVSDEKLKELWSDFLHYIKIARVDMAQSFGRSILESGTESRNIYLLSVQFKDTQDVLRRGQRLEGMKEIIDEIRKVIEEGYEAERADPKQIANSIKLLGGTVRAYKIGLKRLVESGEYAMPQLIQKLMDPKTPELLRERIVTVLPKIGKDAVRPLSVALQSKDVHLQETLARTLGEIQYPHAGARLKELAGRQGILERTKQVATRALVDCTGNESLEKSVAWMFYDLAQKYYRQDDSVKPQEEYETANVWYWKEGLGVVFKPVPREIFCDIHAMRMARLALQHDPDFYPAVSLWLAANLKKQADLPSGAVDPTVGKDQPSADYYALASGAGFLQEVLARALNDRNSAVALGAIEALARTSGEKNLVEPVEGGATPLVEALTYPDRQVRFLAALSLAKALPEKRFAGYKLTMAVLSEALRQSGKKTALLVVEDVQIRNALKDLIRSAGYEVIDQSDDDKALAEANKLGGVDVVVLGDKPEANFVVAKLRTMERFVTVPVMVVSGSERSKRLGELDDRVVAVKRDFEDADILAGLVEAYEKADGKSLTPQQAAQWAIDASDAIRLLGMTENKVFDIEIALNNLVALLGHESSGVQISAAEALAVMVSSDAQKAIAELAINADQETDVRIKAFNILSNSLRRFGNQLTDNHAKAVLDIVNTKDAADLRDAAAQALGAMNLPSKEIKSLILNTEQTEN